MRVDDLRLLGSFDGLNDEQLAELVEGGTEVRIEPGVELFREGEHAGFWWVLVDGAIDLIRHVAARTPWSRGWTCRAAGPAGSAPGTSTASISRPAEE